MEKVYVVGIPPSMDYMIPLASRIIGSSHTLIGAPRLLDMFKDLDGKKLIPLQGGYGTCLEILKGRAPEEKIAVLVSGDPCFYSLGTSLASAMPREELEIVPAIGSMSLAFASLGLAWQDCVFLSFHGRSDVDLDRAIKDPTRPVAVLTGGENGPSSVARAFLDAGPDRVCHVMSDLGMEGERIQALTLSSLAEDRSDFPSLTVLILEGIR